jgi:membrane protein DedA with SNARE-associated domain/rhodanese-related sulfurtransferase
VTSYVVLAATAFAAQALLFVPVIPLLIATGVLASHGTLHVTGAVLALVVGIALGDFLWYVLGRRGGPRVLQRVCRRAIEPDTCVRGSQNLFGRYGARALLIAKFIPGLSTVALPLAGVFGLEPRRFVLLDVLGVTAWTGAYLAAGYLSARHAGIAPGAFARAPIAAVLAAVAALLVYLGWKYQRRRRVASQHRIARLSVADLARKLAAGEDVLVIDLRHRIDFERDPYTIPDALYIPAEELEQHRKEIPHDREVVLYCTCPDEITSARWAIRLTSLGVPRVRPLSGGLSAWRSSGQPVEKVPGASTRHSARDPFVRLAEP